MLPQSLLCHFHLYLEINFHFRAFAFYIRLISSLTYSSAHQYMGDHIAYKAVFKSFESFNMNKSKSTYLCMRKKSCEIGTENS